MKNTHTTPGGVGPPPAPPVAQRPASVLAERAPRARARVAKVRIKAGSSITVSDSVATLPIRTLPIKAWSTEERPRERLISVGAEALSTAELIAILLGSGTTNASAWDVARDLLRTTDGRLRELSTRSYKELERVRGIGEAKAVTLVAALELGRRRSLELDADRPEILTSPAAFAQLAPVLSDLKHEESWVLLLNNASRLIRRERLSSGGLVGTVVDVRSLYALALRHDATSVVLAHNHPSGSLSPSEQDRALTRQLVAAGEVLDIHFGDHLVVAGRRYFSFRDSKLL